MKKIVRIGLLVLLILLLVIGPFIGSEMGTTLDYVLDVLFYYICVFCIVVIPIALLTNVKKIRDKLPLYKNHKIVHTLLGIFITWIIIGIILSICSAFINSLHTEQYRRKVAEQAELEAKEKAEREQAEQKAKEEAEKKEQEQAKKEEQKEAEKKEQEEVEKKEREEAEEEKQEEVEASINKISGNIIDDAQNGLLYVNSDYKITDYEGNIISQYADYSVLDNGRLTTGSYIVEGLVCEGNKIVYEEPVEVEQKLPGEIALSRLEYVEDVGDVRNLIRNHNTYNGKLIKVSGTVHRYENMWYISAGDSMGNWLVLYDLRVFDKNGMGTQLLDGDYVDITGTFYYNTGSVDVYGTTLHSLTDSYAVLDEFWSGW